MLLKARKPSIIRTFNEKCFREGELQMGVIFKKVFNRSFLGNMNLLRDAVIDRLDYLNHLFNEINLTQNSIVLEVHKSLSEKIENQIKQFESQKKEEGKTIELVPIDDFSHDELYFLLVACEYKINFLERLHFQLDLGELIIVIDKYEEIIALILDVFDNDKENKDVSSNIKENEEE